MPCTPKAPRRPYRAGLFYALVGFHHQSVGAHDGQNQVSRGGYKIIPTLDDAVFPGDGQHVFFGLPGKRRGFHAPLVRVRAGAVFLEIKEAENVLVQAMPPAGQAPVGVCCVRRKKSQE